MTQQLVVALLPLALLTAFPALSSAQSPTPPAIEVAAPDVIQEITLRDGTRAFGRVERVAEGRVVFRTLAGATIDIAAVDVLQVAVASGRMAGREFWRADPNPTRLFFGPTARALKRGDAYLGVYEVYIPFVQVGITDRISVGGGTPLWYFEGNDRVYWFTPKVTIVDRGRTTAAAGVMHMIGIDDDSIGVAYGVVTHGSADSAITVGGGYAYARSDEGGGAPVVMFGAEHRVRRGLKLVTENYAFEGGGIISAGVRFMGQRLSADLGLATPLGIDEFFVFPMVNFVWTFR